MLLKVLETCIWGERSQDTGSSQLDAQHEMLSPSVESFPPIFASFCYIAGKVGALVSEGQTPRGALLCYFRPDRQW